jgi:hypothetical protein
MTIRGLGNILPHVMLLLVGSMQLAFADTQHFLVRSPGQPLSDQAAANLQPENAAIISPSEAKKLLRLTLLPARNLNAPINEFVIIHTIRWAESKNPREPVVSGQNWYVYRDDKLQSWSDEDFTTRNRLFGVRNFYFLFVHLNRPSGFDYEAKYDIKIHGKSPLNVSNLRQGAPLFVPPAVPPALTEGLAPLPQPANLWYGAEIVGGYSTSQIEITPSISGVDGVNARTFDNEGYAWWDVGVGVPLTKITMTSYDVANNMVTAKQVDQQNIYALLSVYPKPRDLKGSNFSFWPSAVVGVAVARQPLHKVLLGVGYGLNFAQFYAAALWQTQARPNSTALPITFQTRYEVQASFGILVTLRATKEKLNF